MNTSNQDTRTSSSKLVLYSYWKSSCSWRIRFALNLKSLSYKYKAVNLVKGEQFSPEFERLNPLHFVPVLVDGDVVVADSFAIFLYLEENCHGRTLLPADTQKRALNLQIAGIVSSSIQPLHMLSLLKYVEEKLGAEERLLWARSKIGKGFQALEDLLNHRRRHLHIAVATERFGIDLCKYPTLDRLHQSYKALPEFLASSPEKQPDALS